MRRRVFESLGVAAVLAALVFLLQMSAGGQGPGEGGATAPAGPVPKTAWGHPDLQGIWLDEFDTPLERPARYANREFFTDEERAAQDDERSGNVGRNRRVEAAASRTSPARTTRCSPRRSRRADGRRWSSIRQTAESPRSRRRCRSGTGSIESSAWPSFRTPTPARTRCRPATAGTYGPPSPRLAEVPPFYNTQRMNRHDGPEDQSLGDRCMLGAEPDFNGFRRIVQGPDSVAIGVDTGQGQGYQRVVYLSGKPSAGNIRLRHGDSRGRFEGNSLVVETTNFSPKFPFRGAAENLTLVERFTRLDANTLDTRSRSRTRRCGRRPGRSSRS